MIIMEQLEMFIINISFIICGYALLNICQIHFALSDVIVLTIGQVLLLSLCVLTNSIKIKNMYPDRVLRF